MFDSCQESGGSGGPRCADVAEKLVQLFGWRQTYKVEKLQRSMPDRATTRISITRTCDRNNDLRRKYSLDSSARHQQPATKANCFHNTCSKIDTTNGQIAVRYIVYIHLQEIFYLLPELVAHAGGEGPKGLWRPLKIILLVLLLLCYLMVFFFVKLNRTKYTVYPT